MDSNSEATKEMSPSMITDYFGKSKLKRRVQKGNSSIKKNQTLPSAYLTPESSPGSHSNPESPPCKEDSACEDMTRCPDQDLQSSLKASNIVVPNSSNSIQDSASSNVSKVEGDGANFCASLVESVVTGTDSSQSPKKCSGQEDGSAAKHNEPSEVGSEGSTSPTIVAFQSLDSKAASSPPSLPRLKLRRTKSAKSNFQADVSGVAKEGEPQKPKPGRRKKKDSDVANNRVITDYFQVRRSGRQTKTEIEKEKQLQLEKMILSGCEDGLEVKEFECKGRGVVATKDFSRGDFVVEYAGDLIDIGKAREREEKYAKNPEVGCYMYYFKCGSKQHCVDATAESGKLGRLLNHSSKDGNCCTRSLEVEGTARLILVAKRDISSGEELTYDYGDRSKASIESHPWLKL